MRTTRRRRVVRTWLVVGATLGAAGASGCAAERPRVRPVTTTVAGHPCQRLWADPNRRIRGQLMQGRHTISPHVLFVSLIAGARGCVVQPMPECKIPGAVYQYQLLQGRSEAGRYDWAFASANVDLGVIPVGSRLYGGTGDSVFEQQILKEYWATPAAFSSSQFTEPSCAQRVTHLVHRAETGAWAVARGHASEFGAGLDLFRIAGAQGGVGQQRLVVETGGHPDCRSGECAPVWFYISPISQSAPCQGPHCGQDATLGGRTWTVTLDIDARGCRDGVGACELGGEVTSMAGKWTIQSPQDTPMTRLGPMLWQGAALRRFHVRVVERDEFQDDRLGECDIAVTDEELRRSATGRTPLSLVSSCGAATVSVFAQPQ